MRHATDANGVEWEIFVEWEGRKTLHRAFRRLRAHREARAQGRSENRDHAGLDGCDPFGGLGDELAVIALFMVVSIVLLFFGPWLFAAFLGLLELGIIIVAVMFGFVGRTLFRRPWRVAAVSQSGTVWAWQQIGFGKARRLVHEIADGLESGWPPRSFAPDRLESPTAYELGPDPDFGPLMKPEIRFAIIGFNIIATAVAVFLLIQRLS